MTIRQNPKDLPEFLFANADELPDPDAARGVATVYVDTLAEYRAHPNHGAPVRRDELPTPDGPPTFQRIEGRLDGLMVAMKLLAAPLANKPGYSATWA